MPERDSVRLWRRLAEGQLKKANGLGVHRPLRPGATGSRGIGRAERSSTVLVGPGTLDGATITVVEIGAFREGVAIARFRDFDVLAAKGLIGKEPPSVRSTGNSRFRARSRS